MCLQESGNFLKLFKSECPCRVNIFLFMRREVLMTLNSRRLAQICYCLLATLPDSQQNKISILDVGHVHTLVPFGGSRGS